MPRFHALVLASTLVASTAFAADRTYDVEGFQNVEISDGVEATIVSGKDFSVEADAKRGDIDRLIVKMRGDTLSVSRKSSWGLLNPGRKDRFVVGIHLPFLTDVTANAGASVEVSGEVDDLNATASSGADLRLRDIEVRGLSLSASSGASLRADGTCDDVQATSSSGASLRAADMTCTTGTLNASSGASLNADVTGSADINASSGSSIRLKGGATLTSTEISSGGSFSQD